MKVLTSAAHHDDDVTRDFVWTRVDAGPLLSRLSLARLLRALIGEMPAC
jgi:hypothetical protein